MARAAVAMLALWSAVSFYNATAGATGANADVYKVGEQAARFHDLISALPAAGIIGYVSDAPASTTLGAALYSSAQYTLAPRLVTDRPVNPPAEWVIGDFSQPLDVVQFGNQRGLMLVRDFGNGAVLYRNRVRYMLDTVSILLALLPGILLVRAFDPVRRMQPRWAATLFTVALGVGAGAGLASIAFFILDVAGAATRASVFASDAVWLALAGWLWRARRVARAEGPALAPPTRGFRWI